MDFKEMFKELTGNRPYPWQQRLYDLFLQDKIPSKLDIPTGLGKTSIISIWLIAKYNSLLADGKTRIPSRLIYIVDRRVIVDQASDEVKKLQIKIKEIMKDKIKHFSTSMLRGGGGMADSREWLKHPEGPSIIIGTVDMIGSRLYFSGYGLGNKIRAFYAGLLGQDSLIILDEAHLSPALVQSLRDTQKISQNVKESIFPPKMCFMSATQQNHSIDGRFELDNDDRKHEKIKKRLMAEKYLQLIQVEKEQVMEEIFKRALDTKGRVLIYLQKPRDVQAVKEKLEKAGKVAKMLTGTLRGWERDKLTEDPTYKLFLSKTERIDEDETCFLVSTSAGEVGVDFDADHMLCDLTTFDSLIQRFGRVNRSGGRTSNITIVYAEKTAPKTKDDEKKDPLEETRLLLERLVKKGTYDASPYNLAKIEPKEREVTSASNIGIQPLTKDILDMWSMTSIYEEYSSRPAVHHWLRGKPDKIMPDTYVAWRNDVKDLANHDEEKITDVLESYRILPHEIARDSSKNVHNILQKIIDKSRIIIIGSNGKCYVKNIKDVKEEDICFATILLPSNSGGLDSDGFLGISNNPVQDVADEYQWTQKSETNTGKKSADMTESKSLMRTRLVVQKSEDGHMHIIEQINQKEHHESLDDWITNNRQMRLVNVIKIDNDDEDESSKEIHYYVKKSDLQQSTSSKSQTLHEHLEAVKLTAEEITKNMRLDKNLKDAIITASKYHDIGKADPHWQNCMHIKEEERPLAKTGHRQRPLNMGGFRHELASVVSCASESEIINHVEKDLVLHLIAAHHGWARPCFKHNALITDKNNEIENTLKRYDVLQKRFGAYGLAWLESIVRSADWQASEKQERP